MSLGGHIDMFIACDGEDFLGDRYDGNECILSTQGFTIDVGHDDNEQKRHEALDNASVLAWKAARDAGWRPAPSVMDVSKPGHLCPVCVKRVIG